MQEADDEDDFEQQLASEERYRDFQEPRETPESTMLINDTDMTLRPVKASQTAAPQARKKTTAIVANSEALDSNSVAHNNEGSVAGFTATAEDKL